MTGTAMISAPTSPELASLTDRIDGLTSAIEAAKSQAPDRWPVALHKLKIRWTADSNAIEGSSLSFADTLFFLEQGLTVAGKPLKDFLDARNHAAAIDLVFEVAGVQRPVTEGLLKELNALILDGVDSVPTLDRHGRMSARRANPGLYKAQANHVLLPDGTLHTYVDPVHVPSEMAALVAWIEGEPASTHPTVRAAVAHWHLVRIHPFEDGNGRLARLLMNLILIRAHAPPIVIRNEDRAVYLEALRRADGGDVAGFVAFVLRSCERTLTELAGDLA